MKSEYSLLVVLDRRLPGTKEVAYGKKFDKTTLYLNTGRKLIPLSAIEISRCYYAFNRKLPPALRKDDFSMEKLRPLIEKRIGKKYAAVLLDKKTKFNLNILINSGGGGAFYKSILKRVIEFVKGRKGKVNSFTFLYAYSAAQILFSETEKRYCLKFSEFLCHRGYSPDDSYKKSKYYDEDIERNSDFHYHKEMLTKFFERHKPSADEKIEKLMQDALQKPKHDLFLSGYLAERWGMADKAFHSYDDFAASVQKHIGRAAFEHDRVSRLIKKAGRAYEKLLSGNNRYGLRYPFFESLNDMERELLKSLFGDT